MSEETEIQKTPQDKLNAVISRLKEMEHYSRGNIEHLGKDWFELDEELKRKDLSKKMEPLMDYQSKIEEHLTEIIEEFEAISLE